MSPKKRGAELDKYSCEYIIYGDFERHAPYSFNTTAYWVTLSKMVEDVKKKKAEEEIVIFDGERRLHFAGGPRAGTSRVTYRTPSLQAELQAENFKSQASVGAAWSWRVRCVRVACARSGSRMLVRGEPYSSRTIASIIKSSTSKRHLKV